MSTTNDPVPGQQTSNDEQPSRERSVVIPKRELRYTSSRSSGPGGQNVNKVETKVTLIWDVAATRCLSDEQKHRLMSIAGSRMNAEGVISITSQEGRSQLENKARCHDLLLRLIAKALARPKLRRPTKVPVSVRRERARTKKKDSERKTMRRPVRPRSGDDE